MGGDSLGGAPSFPVPLLVLVTAIMGAGTLLALRRVEGRAARFVVAAIWLRYILSVFHRYTFGDAIAGLSINALGSIAITGVGILVIQPRHLMLKMLVPAYAIILLSLISAGLNSGVMSGVDSVVKFAYFVVLAIAIYEALRENGPDRLLLAMFWSFAPLLIFQFLSIATGTAKASELDGSVSFIGGYNHEAAFSVALATFFVAVSFSSVFGRILKVLLLTVLAVGIAIANYRTTILALLPLAAWQVVGGATIAFRREQRIVLLMGMTVIALIGITFLAFQASDRFADLGHFLQNPGQFIKPITEFTQEERRLLSGRAYIWSSYIFTWVDANNLRHIFGFGPGSWQNFFRVYPHNTLVAFLFELGIAGLIALVWFWGKMFGVALRAQGAMRINLLLAHISFILMNLATMALWQIEGIILYALICGFSQFEAVRARDLRRTLSHGLDNNVKGSAITIG